MKMNRRQALFTTLFGAGGVGLRALATGLPAAFFLDPRKAMAAGPDAGACGAGKPAQYFIVSINERGCPINATTPGTHGVPGVILAPSNAGGVNMTPTKLSQNGVSVTGAYPWSTLPQAVLDRTLFFHMATNNNGHGELPSSLSLGDTSKEMLPSLLAKATAASLHTIQSQPVVLGAVTPLEDVSFGGAPQPIIPPAALQDTLLNPSGPGLDAITNLQQIRDKTMNSIYAHFYRSGTPTQKAYINALANTQTEARILSQSLLSQLGSLTYNAYDPVSAGKAELQAAVILIQMNVAPVFTVRLSFGGDNHSDPGYATEATSTSSAVDLLSQTLWPALQAAGLQDKVCFMTLNVFGRTLGSAAEASGGGRQHNGNHHVSVCIGAPFKGGVIGGCGPLGTDFGCLNIDPASGAGLPSSGSTGIAATDALGAFGMTMLAAVGGDPTQAPLGPTGTAQVVCAALR